MNFRKGEGLLGNSLEMRGEVCVQGKGSWRCGHPKEGSQGLQLLCCERTSPASKRAVLQEERCRLGWKMEKCRRCSQAQWGSGAGIGPIAAHRVCYSTCKSILPLPSVLL